MPLRIRPAVQPEDRLQVPDLPHLALVEILELLVEDLPGDYLDPGGYRVAFRTHDSGG